MTTRMITLSFVIAAGCTACATNDSAIPGQAQSTEPQMTDDNDQPREVEITTHRYSVRLREGDALWLVNEHGDLRIRMSGDSGVHYAAVIQKLDGEQRDVDFGTDRQPGGLAFGVNPPDGWIGRVDASARVPEPSRLHLETTGGLIEVRAGSNEVNARTTSGEIRYRGTGPVTALSDSGNIQVAMHGLNYRPKAGSVMTASGDVEVWVMPGADLVVRCRAGRKAVNEVPAGLGSVVDSGGGRMSLTLGAGSSELAVQAGGDIVIRALPGL